MSTDPTDLSDEAVLMHRQVEFMKQREAVNDDQPRWTGPLVRDVTTNVLRSLLDGGVTASRERVVEALAAAGIAPGEIR